MSRADSDIPDVAVPGRQLPGPAVLVVDDHELVRDSMVMALRRHGTAAFQCTATGIDEIIAEAAFYPPGLVLLDLDLGQDRKGHRVDGVDAVRALIRNGWKVLVVSGSSNEYQIAAAIAAGAVGEIKKTLPFAALAKAVKDAAAGHPLMSAAERQRWLTLHWQRKAEERVWHRLIDRLTARERAVLERLAEGHRAAAIADEFMVSLATVRSQIQSILTKLEVSSQLEAVAMARRHRTEW